MDNTTTSPEGSSYAESNHHLSDLSDEEKQQRQQYSHEHKKTKKTPNRTISIIQDPIYIKTGIRNKFIIELIYFSLTAFLMITIILAAVINITRGNQPEIFISLLSTCMGVILPQPGIRNKIHKAFPTENTI